MSLHRRVSLPALALALGAALFNSALAYAEVTTGGVVWREALGYPKPPFVPITVPDEATCPNKYYLDFSTGSGSTCSAADPCGDMSALAGKPGLAGGPAYVYLRGSGSMLVFNQTFYGSAGNEIVIKPWGAATVTFSHSAGNQGIAGSTAHHVIIDGGPNLALEWVSDLASGFGANFELDDFTLYRVLVRAPPNGGSLLNIGFNGGGHRVRIINVEFAGGPSDALTVNRYSDVSVKGCLFHHTERFAVYAYPTVASTGLTIDGCAIHDVGNAGCTNNLDCWAAISIDGALADPGATLISNNLIWAVASSCVWDRGGSVSVFHNTCIDYGRGGPVTHQEAVAGYNNGATAVVRNNIFYSPLGQAALDASPFTASNNLCQGSCGSASHAFTPAALQSLDAGSPDFLVLSATSVALDAAPAAVAADYRGVPRPQGLAGDLGAFEDCQGSCVAADGGSLDAGAADAGSADAGAADAGVTDGGASTPDAGNGDRGSDVRPRGFSLGCGCQGASGLSPLLGLLALLWRRQARASAAPNSRRIVSSMSC